MEKRQQTNPSLLLFLLLPTVGCQTETTPPRIEILTGGVLTCINVDDDTTCFGGEVPNQWDGQTMPEASIVFHRKGETAKVVSEFSVCTSSGECFGDPIVGIDASAVALAPINYDHWREVKSSRNLTCATDHADQLDCWGDEWGMFFSPKEDLHFPRTQFDAFSVGQAELCGTRDGVLSCYSLYSGEVTGKVTGNYHEPCTGFPLVCARHGEQGSTIACWDTLYRGCDPPIELGKPTHIHEGVLEYGCYAGSRCFNRGDSVECFDSKEQSHSYDLELTQLSVGAAHFCGINPEGHVVCRTFEDLSKLRNYRLLAPIPRNAWLDLATPKPNFGISKDKN